MAEPKDFSAKRIRTSALIASGGVGNSQILIYSASDAGNFQGGFKNTSMLDNVGKDVFLFVSGTKSDPNHRGHSEGSPAHDINAAVTLFGGDVVVSGTLYAERQVIDVDEQVAGDFYVTGNIYQEPKTNSTTSVAFRRSDGATIFNVDTTNKRVGIGTDSPDYRLHVKAGASNSAQIAVTQVNNSQFDDPANIRAQRSRGTVASPAKVNNNDMIGNLAFHGHDGNDFDHTSAEIRGVADGAVSENNTPGRLELRTNSGGTSTSTRIVVRANGKVGIGNRSDYDHFPKGVLDVAGDGSTSQVFILSGAANTSAASLNESGYDDLAFFVSGAIGSRGTNVKGTSIFGGDLLTSGSLFVDEVENTGPNKDITFKHQNSPKMVIQNTKVDFSANIEASADDQYDIGSATNNFQTAHVREIDVKSGNPLKIKNAGVNKLEIRNSETITLSDIRPNSDLGQSLGTSAERFDTIHTKYIAGEDAETKLIELRADNSAPKSDNYVFILSGSTDNGDDVINPANFTDTSFFVSGSINDKNDESRRGTSVFGGDTVISGALYLEELPAAPASVGDGTVALYGKDDSGVTKLYFKNESGELEVGSGGGTLDEAYDFGGTGAGHEITVDGDPIKLTTDHTRANNANKDALIIGADSGALTLSASFAGNNSVITHNNNNTSRMILNSQGEIVLRNHTGVTHTHRFGQNTSATTLVFSKSPSPDLDDTATAQLDGTTLHTSKQSWIQKSGADDLVLGCSKSIILKPAIHTAGSSVIINEDSKDADFRVESNNKAGAFIVDGGTNQVIIGGTGTSAADQYRPDHSVAASALPDDVGLFISGAIDSKSNNAYKGVTLFGGDAVISGALYLEELPANLPGITDGTVALFGKDVGGVTKLFFKNESGETEVGGGGGTPGGASGELQFNDAGAFGGHGTLTFDSSNNTLSAEKLEIGSSGDGLKVTTSGIVINEGSSGTKDFRIESNSNQHMFFIDSSTDRISIGKLGNSPQTTIHIKDSSPTLRIERNANGEESSIEFAGQLGAVGAMIHEDGKNDLVFKTFDGGDLDEMLRLTGHFGSPHKQVIIMSGSDFGDDSMHPREAEDISFFLSGAIDSKGSNQKGVSVIGGDTVISGALYLEELPSTLPAIADGTVALFGKDVSGVTKLFFKNESGETELGAGGVPGGASGEIQFNDGGSFDGHGTLTFDSVNNRLAASEIEIDDFLYHKGDTDTYIQFQTNQVNHFAAGKNHAFIYGSTSGTGKVEINKDNENIDFRVNTQNTERAIFVNSDIDAVVFGDDFPPGEDIFVHFSGSIGDRHDNMKGSMISFGGDVVVSGSLHAAIPEIITLAYADGSGNGKEYIPLVGSVGEMNSPASFLAMSVRPYDGRLLKVMLRSNNAMGSTTVGLHKAGDTAAGPSTTASNTVTVNAQFSQNAYEYDFSDQNAFYSKGDVIAISVDPTNNHGTVTATVVLENYFY